MVWPKPLDMGSVFESVRPLYNSLDYTSSAKQPLTFEVPLKNNGLYLLIAKFSNVFSDVYAQTMTFNNEVLLQTNVSLYNLCGGEEKICDEYFYFCVSEDTLHYKGQSLLIRNQAVRLEIRPVKGPTWLGSLY
jgi:hypothetical protein